MAKSLSKYTYDDLKNPDNNCIVSTLKQLAQKSDLPYLTVRRIFSNGRKIYYDQNGKFKLEKRDHYIAITKARKKITKGEWE
jgi:hypothetical protein